VSHSLAILPFSQLYLLFRSILFPRFGLVYIFGRSFSSSAWPYFPCTKRPIICFLISGRCLALRFPGMRSLVICFLMTRRVLPRPPAHGWWTFSSQYIFLSPIPVLSPSKRLLLFPNFRASSTHEIAFRKKHIVLNKTCFGWPTSIVSCERKWTASRCDITIAK